MKKIVEDAVKTLGMVAIIFSLMMLAVGCTGNDRDAAGLQRRPAVPPTEASPAPPPNGGQIGAHFNSEANGGTSLAVAAPYSGTGASAPQNINPGPFLTASQNQSGAQNGPATNPNMLTRSADGTMSGPNDLPAATTGWGATAADYSSPLALGKAQKKKSPLPPK